ncbi:hypothetical protein Taro_040150 [Colocasia esculenta]|uniref:Uncharacterized protein n=1 Tax=Colocasia esculenta TaxID=4460 RepID=A0A843WTM3_COLES|nr:hypothetical protein [Colocasia esculenta]
MGALTSQRLACPARKGHLPFFPKGASLHVTIKGRDTTAGKGQIFFVDDNATTNPSRPTRLGSGRLPLLHPPKNLEDHFPPKPSTLLFPSPFVKPRNPRRQPIASRRDPSSRRRASPSSPTCASSSRHQVSEPRRHRCEPRIAVPSTVDPSTPTPAPTPSPTLRKTTSSNFELIVATSLAEKTQVGTCYSTSSSTVEINGEHHECKGTSEDHMLMPRRESAQVRATQGFALWDPKSCLKVVPR